MSGVIRNLLIFMMLRFPSVHAWVSHVMPLNTLQSMSGRETQEAVSCDSVFWMAVVGPSSGPALIHLKHSSSVFHVFDVLFLFLLINAWPSDWRKWLFGAKIMFIFNYFIYLFFSLFKSGKIAYNGIHKFHENVRHFS